MCIHRLWDRCLHNPYERLLQVPDENTRTWYEKEAIEHSWSVRTLRRIINTQYYDRMLLTIDKDSVEAKMLEKANLLFYKKSLTNSQLF